MTSVIWRRLDVPGHDACRLEQGSSGWRVRGAAVFRENGVVACLDYEVACDPAWRTTRGEVRGFMGDREVDLRVVRTANGLWTLNGAVVPRLDQCVDLDLGFTPATNLLQIRRTALAVGQAADVPVAWLDPAAGTLDLLAQRYERRGELSYWYEAPRFQYSGLIEVDGSAFVTRYPGLWESES